MKKLMTVLLLGFMFALGLSMVSVYAEESTDLIELYPYDQKACLDATNACTQLKVGNSHWTFTYYGHRYHVVRGSARYVTDFEDLNADGYIDALEMTAMSWNAFASLIINDTDESVVLKTANARTDLTSVVHRMYSYFDETGVLQMFEDHISAYWIFNDGTVEEPDWRLATQAEIAAYNAAAEGEKPITTRNTHIRMKLDAEDSDGYVLEPLRYLQWVNADVVKAEAPMEEWSSIIDGDPDYVSIPAGWTVISFGTLDRGTSNVKTRDFIVSLPKAMLDNTVAPLEINYDHQPAIFTGLTALDDDLVTPGINIVVEYNGAFDLPVSVSSSWLNMFDEDGFIMNKTEKLNYLVNIWQNNVILETIHFTYDNVSNMYSASAPVTVVNTSNFGASYIAEFITETPKGHETVATADIIIGVMPPKYAGVQNRYANEGIYVDLLEGITADNGYGVDITDSIKVSYPNTFNLYYTLPGQYKIDLEFTYNVYIEGEDAFIDLNGTIINFDASTNIISTNFAPVIAVYTDAAPLKASTFSWGSSGILIEVVDGTVVRTINRTNWNLVDENGTNTPENASNMFAGWLENLELSENHFVILVGRTTGAPNATAAALAYGDAVSYDLTVIQTVDHDFVINASYMLTVDDITPPVLLVVNENLNIIAGQFANVNQAVLSNVVAFDNFDDAKDVAVYVSNAGGLNVNTPGTYTVEVTAEDFAGNQTVQTFTVVVHAAPQPPKTDAEIQAMIDEAVEAAIAELEGKLLTEEEIQAMIDAAVQDILDQIDVTDPIDDATGCLGSIVVKDFNFSTIIMPLMGVILLIGIAVVKRRF